MGSRRPLVLAVDSRRPDPGLIARAVQALRRGGLIILPTDTVYGVAADPSVPGAEQRLAEAKGRDPDKPIPLLAADTDDIVRWGGVLDGPAMDLARRFWPGPLTLVLKTAGGEEGFRVPDHAVTRAVLKAAGGVLRVSSANRSGQAPAGDARSAVAALAGRVDVVLDAGPAPGGAASTVARVTEEGVQVLRAGAIPAHALRPRPLILFVCTGNICRSPMAEYLLRRWLGPASPWDVQSAGLAAGAGMAASEGAVTAPREKGIDLSPPRSQPLSRALVDAARVIVVMTRSQQSAVRRVHPEAADRVFLLKSFGYASRNDDLVDPLGSPVEAYRAARDQIDAVLPDLAIHLHEMEAGWEPSQRRRT
jgi:L-threonylcarbamoyladenylate synthase